MLRCNLSLFKKFRAPLGMSESTFRKKMRNPRSSKPWQNRSVETSGALDITGAMNVMGDDGTISLGNLAHGAPMGISLDYSTVLAPRDHGAESPRQRIGDGAHDDGDSVHHSLVPSIAADGESGVQNTVLASIPAGQNLNLDVNHVKNYTENGNPSAIPLTLQKFMRTRREAAESIRLPRHLNKLFHRLMRWTEESVALDESAPLQPDQAGSKLPPSSLEAKLEYSKTSNKIKYGVLMDEFEKDKFAVENNLQIVGRQFEKKFMEWDGMRVMDNPVSQLQEVKETKSSLIMHGAQSFKVPEINHDACSGCGVQLQDKCDTDFGYVSMGDVEGYVSKHHNAMQARAEYADRMAELQAHWEKNGRRVGEEWLDFMTQDEFYAIYRYKTQPFICNRCTKLENYGSHGRRKVLAAPDFTEQLKALKEKKCVVVLVIDVNDFPGSMVYDLPGLISMNNPVIIAVNKMDCIRQRRFGYTGPDMRIVKKLIHESHIVPWVTNIATQFGLPRHQIKAVIPVSSKMGWGVDKLLEKIEELTNLNLRYQHKPIPAYFVGVTNAGKSSLINAIAHYLYIPVPPTPTSTKVYYKTLDKRTRKERIFWKWYTPPHSNRQEMGMISAYKSKEASKLLTVSALPGTTLATNAVKISLAGKSSDQCYLFDTPGLFPHWHQSSPLNLQQMRHLLMRKFRNPECYVLLPGNTLFLSGLAAIDIVKGSSEGFLMMVYCSSKVKNAIIDTDKSDQFWSEQLGKALYPPGSLEQVGDQRLTESKSYLFECFPQHRKRPKADIYVCGVGWVSFCVMRACDAVIRVRTLPGVVHGVREPLRYKDLACFRNWPKLRRGLTTRPSPPSMDKVIRLVNEEVDPTAPAMRMVEKTKGPAANVPSSSTPFDNVVKELQFQGKLPT